jgi:hypothetical protein
MSDLIVTGYPDEATAQNALHGDDPTAPTWEQPASAGATT